MKPRILLIGAGRFGLHHLRLLKNFDKKNIISFAGVVVRDSRKATFLEKEYGVKVYAKITPELLKNVDAVDIVTPPETHYELIKECLKYTNVFVEKPFTENSKDALNLEKLARTHKRLLTVGHIFRFHPVSSKLKKMAELSKMPKKIIGSFVNPIDSDQGREPSFELLHLFDVVDFLWSTDPEVVFARNFKRITSVDIRYKKKNDAHFILGWNGEEKIRQLKLIYDTYSVEADFVKNIILKKTAKGQKQYHCKQKEELLQTELLSFITSLKKKGTLYAFGNATTARRIISISERAIPPKTKIPKIAIIGGGIFGTSVAAELSTHAKVTIFEKNDDLMKEGSFINQFRHHRGYHYPRSDETVQDIKRSSADFENIFKKAIISTYPTYYGLAKEGSLVNEKDFLKFCQKHDLPYIKEFPQGELLNTNAVSLSVKVPEANYHHATMKAIIKERLASFSNVTISYNTSVIGYHLESTGMKTVSYMKKGTTKKEQFDFIINATYANINHLSNDLGFEVYPIRIDLAEVLIVKLPIDPVSITIVDGPFATLMPTGNPHEFTLYHVKESIIDRYVPKKGLLKKPIKRVSRQEVIFSESLKLFPILKDAEIVESRVVNRGVAAYHEHDDSRVADIIEHGFGCWSILSGKILSSVTTGKRLAELIRLFGY